jgi:hypothetical protein
LSINCNRDQRYHSHHVYVPLSKSISDLVTPYYQNLSSLKSDTNLFYCLLRETLRLFFLNLHLKFGTLVVMLLCRLNISYPLMIQPLRGFTGKTKAFDKGLILLLRIFKTSSFQLKHLKFHHQ